MVSLPTPLGRLLSVISWEGSSVRMYRRGGRGLENVLTLDVMGALDTLPREHGDSHRSENSSKHTANEENADGCLGEPLRCLTVRGFHASPEDVSGQEWRRAG